MPVFWEFAPFLVDFHGRPCQTSPRVGKSLLGDAVGGGIAYPEFLKILGNFTISGKCRTNYPAMYPTLHCRRCGEIGLK